MGVTDFCKRFPGNGCIRVHTCSAQVALRCLACCYMVNLTVRHVEHHYLVIHLEGV